MNLNNFTIKAQEAVQKASEIASGNQQQAIETAHLLKGLLSVDENVISYLFKKLNINSNRITEVIDAQIQSFPKVSGSEIYLSSGANAALQKGMTYLKEFKDEFVSVEHVLLGLLSTGDKVSTILKDAGMNEADLKKAILELRGNTRVTGFPFTSSTSTGVVFAIDDLSYPGTGFFSGTTAGLYNPTYTAGSNTVIFTFSYTV